jgi:lysozyme
MSSSAPKPPNAPPAGCLAFFAAFSRAPAVAPDGAQPTVVPLAPVVRDGLTARIACELICHEAIVCEAYKDSVGVWTWGIGVTDKSGHKVGRYIDKPQPVERCLEIYIWLLRNKYLPGVLKAFRGYQLTEAQLGAALSFHYNTGAIGTASWVKLWKAGQIAEARASFMQWRKPPEIIERRRKECQLFFDGKWSSDGKCSVIPVRKPSYQPDFRNAKRVDVMPAISKLLGG